MKFSKILLIISIVVVISTFMISTSFAASSETLSLYKESQNLTYNKKVSTIDSKYVYKNKKDNLYLNIKVKKDYQKKYRIKSVNTKYFTYNKIGVFQKTVYKTYNGKNKRNIIINIPKYSQIAKMTINYKTNAKLKKESTNFFINSAWKDTSYFQSKKAKAIAESNGYFKVKGKNIVNVPKYQKVNIFTKSKNYKMKSIRLIVYNTTSKKKQNMDFIPEDVNKFVDVSYKFSKELQFLGIKIYYY